eukprot:tig00020911_g15749.t1
MDGLNMLAASPDPSATAAGARVACAQPSTSASAGFPAPASATAPTGSPLPVAAPAATPEVPKESEYERLWKQVTGNPAEFQTWTNLIQITEREQDNTEKLRKVYDAFLNEYPLCYGYWKKYADLELKKGFPDRTRDVYERGVAGIPHSVDLWTHYCTFVLERGDPEDAVRNL